MPEHPAESEPTLTVAEVSEIVGDDIAFWLGNPFMTPDMLTEKVCWWVTRARNALADRPSSTGQADGA